MPKKEQFSGRVNVFNQIPIFSVGELVLLNDNEFRFKIDVAQNDILETYFIPKKTQSIIHSGISGMGYLEPHYYITPTIYYASKAFAQHYLPVKLLRQTTSGQAKIKFVDLLNPFQGWYSYVFLQLPSPINQNAMSRVEINGPPNNS